MGGAGSSHTGDPVALMRFESIAKVLAKRMLEYYTTSLRIAALLCPHRKCANMPVRQAFGANNRPFKSDDRVKTRQSLVAFQMSQVATPSMLRSRQRWAHPAS